MITEQYHNRSFFLLFSLFPSFNPKPLGSFFLFIFFQQHPCCGENIDPYLYWLAIVKSRFIKGIHSMQGGERKKLSYRNHEDDANNKTLICRFCVIDEMHIYMPNSEQDSSTGTDSGSSYGAIRSHGFFPFLLSSFPFLSFLQISAMKHSERQTDRQTNTKVLNQ